MKSTLVTLTLTMASLAAAVGGSFYSVFPTKPQPKSQTTSGSLAVGQPPDVLRTNAEIREEAVQRSTKHLEWARTESERARREQLARVRRFILSSKNGTRRFADQALSFRSKWKRLVDYLPFTDGNRSERFLGQQFRDLVFDVDDVEAVIASSVHEFVRSLEAIDDDMLVRIEMDIADLPKTAMSGLAEGEALDVAFKRTLESTVSHVGDGVQREVSTMVAADVVGWIAARLMMSSTLMAGGAAGSGITLGASVAVAVIADIVISWAWDKLADPRGKLARELNGRINRVARQVLDGQEGQPGLSASLAELARSRDRVRRKTLLQLIRGQEKESR